MALVITVLATAALVTVFICWGDLLLTALARLSPSAPLPAAATHLLCALGAGGVIVSSLTLALGLLHLLYLIPLCGLLLLGPLLSLITRRPAALRALVRENATSTLTLFWRTPDTAERGLIVLCAVVLLAMSGVLLVLASVPIYDPDGLIYHMEVPRLYAQGHAIAPLHGINDLGNKPFAVDMWHLISLLLGVPTAAKMLNVVALVALIATLLVAAYTHLGVRSAGILAVGAVVVAAQPMALTLASWSYVELPLSWYEGLMLLALLDWLALRDWRPALLIGLYGGMVMASKEAGIAALVGVVPVMGVIVLWRHRWRQGALALILVGVTALLVAGPWYLRGLLWSGDITGIGAQSSGLVHAMIPGATAYMPTTPSTSLVDRVLLAWQPTAYVPHPPGLPFLPGDPLLLLALAALILQRRRPVIVLGLLAVLHLWLWQHFPVGYRQFFPYLPLLLLLGIAGWHEANRLPLRRLLNAMLGAVLVGQVLLAVPSLQWASFAGSTLLGDAVRAAFVPGSEAAFLRQHVPGYRIMETIDRLYGTSRGVAFLIVDLKYGYYLTVPHALADATQLAGNARLDSPAAVRRYLYTQHLCGLLTLRRDLQNDLPQGPSIPLEAATGRALATVFRGPGFKVIDDGYVIAVLPMTDDHLAYTCTDALRSGAPGR